MSQHKWVDGFCSACGIYASRGDILSQCSGRDPEWSKEPPTSVGYYWLYVPEWNLDPEIVWVFNSGGVADPCFEFNRMIDGYNNPDYVTAPTDAQWMKIESQSKPKE